MSFSYEKCVQDTGAVRPLGYITRKETFSASHRLNSTKLTSEENEKLFGKCNNLNGHGHNYTVKVTLRGRIDDSTGMIINIDELKQCMKLAIVDVLDHKNLDLDVPYFKEVVSTTENIAVFVWNNMIASLSDPSILYEVKIYETDKNTAYYRGELLE